MPRTDRPASLISSLQRAAIAAPILLAGCALFQPSGNSHVPQPARAVDLPRYLGVWHEYARYEASFERGCEAVTATYTTRPDGLIGVANACVRDGKPTVAHARAYVVAGSGNAKLKVSFYGPLFIGTYWVLDHGAEYDWSIVGEPSGGYLWLLTRAAHPDPALAAALVARAGAMGYDLGRLRLTRQP